MSDQPPVARFTGAVLRTRAATGLTLRRRDVRAVFGVVTVGYFVVYLWATGHLVPGLGGYGVTVVADPLSKFLRPVLGPLSFTPVARVALGSVTYLFSLNSVVGLGCRCWSDSTWRSRTWPGPSPRPVGSGSP